VNLDEGNPLLGKHIYDMEKKYFGSSNFQDSAVFFSKTGKDKPLEIAQNYLNHGCIGCDGGVCSLA